MRYLEVGVGCSMFLVHPYHTVHQILKGGRVNEINSNSSSSSSSKSNNNNRVRKAVLVYAWVGGYG